MGVWENEGGVGRVWLCSGIGAVVGLFYREIHLRIKVVKHAQNRFLFVIGLYGSLWLLEVM